MTANQMMMVVVAWQMYDLTDSAFDLGLVGLVQFLPSLLLSLLVGHVADRHDRRRILAGCFVVQILIALTLAAGSLGGWLQRDVILLCSLALGKAKAFQAPAQQAIAPLLVPVELLPRALASMSAGTQFGIIAGPALGGLLYIAGAHAAHLASATVFLCCLLLTLGICLDHKPAAREPVTLQSLFAGVAFIWKRKDVLGAISLDLFAVLLGGATALLPIYAKDILYVGPLGLGLLRSASAAGALMMSLWLTRHPIHRHVGRIMFGAVAIYGAAILVFGLSRSFPLSLAALACSGAFDMISVVIRQSLVQLDTPDAMRGRVSAVNGMFIGASNQLGEFRAGMTAAWIGTAPTVLFGGAATLAVVAAWMKLFPSLAKRQRLMKEM